MTNSVTNYMTKLKTGIAIGALIAGTILGAASAQANVTYHYQGNDFTSGTGSITTSMHIEIDLIVASALAASTSYDFTTDPFISYTASVMDGMVPFFTLTSGDSGLTASSFEIGTVGTGNIDSWRIELSDSNGCLPGSIICSISTWNGVGEFASIEFMNAIGNGQGLRSADGTWSIPSQPAPSPEVTGLMLGGLGLMGFVALRRK